MKYLLTVAFLVATTCCIAQSPLNGQWSGSRETPNGTMEFTYNLKVEKDSVLTGFMKTQFGEIKIEEGKVDGKKFWYSLSFNDNKFKSAGELINDDEIVIKSDRGEMKLKRVK